MRRFWFVILLLVVGCGAPRDPVTRLIKQYEGTPFLSITLEDMKITHSPFPEYYHEYQILHGETAETMTSEKTGWIRVSGKVYRKREGMLGMSLYSRNDKQEFPDPHPAGYGYVGDDRYGHWRTDDRGNRFWEFFGKYMFFSSMFRMFSGPVYYRDYDMYRSYRSAHRPFFGSHRQYGTAGAYTRKTNKSYFQRTRTSGNDFKSRVSRRMGRSRSGFSSRGGGFGK